ncbi:hypothetical protein HYT45_01320 [Candidatus Uhrbacteria bacterium]|nr:hypothetical protein [Candidatus Uhrbacteria bacterium]
MRYVILRSGGRAVPSITADEFKALLPAICDRETSQDAEHWTPENPLVGHCAVVSLVAQNLFGGELLRGSLLEVPGFEYMRSHYWNRLADGTVEDFTKPQFGDKYPEGLKSEPKDRSYVLFDPKTGAPREIMKRYKLLAWRLAKALSGGNPLFEDGYYRQCFDAALDSPCQKMKFGCVITHGGYHVIYKGCNETIPGLKTLCEPKCIRFGIASRTESMLGACGHAEERGIWTIVGQGRPLAGCKLYVAGFYPNGLPWIKERAEHTCLRCAVQMNYAGLDAVVVPTVIGWVSMTTAVALETALAYATGEKKV